MQPRVYQMDSKYRRCCIYLLVGSGVISVVAYSLPYGDHPDAWQRHLVWFIVGGAAIAYLLRLFWSLHVDERGIERRSVTGSDVWTWDDFASGRIQKRARFIFVDPDRSFSCRTLDLDLLDEPERKELIQLINQHYRLPPPPVLPETLTIVYGFRRQVTFTPGGIELRTRGVVTSFAWCEVTRLHITRHDPLRRDFARLLLTVGTHEVELKIAEPQSWSGASAEEINDYLLGQVPHACVDIDILGERPARAEDAQRELDKLYRLKRERRITLWVCGVLAAGGLVGMLFVGLIFTLVMSVPFSPMILLYWVAVRHACKKENESERRILGFLNEFGGSPNLGVRE